MTTRQLRKKKYAAIKEIITKNAQLNPSDGCYNMTLEINKTDYVLKLQFTDNNKLIVWNAMEVNHGEDGQVNYTLIIDNKVLSALTEILLWQNVPMFKKKHRVNTCKTRAAVSKYSSPLIISKSN